MERRHRGSANTSASDLPSDSSPDKSEYEKQRPRKRRPDQFKVRVLQRNLVFCVGLSEEISAPEVHYALVKVLGQHKYLGQYGKIEKISTNRNNFSNKNQKGPSFSTYITFSNNLSAALAILALNNLTVEQRTIRACYGTTKYCTFFLKRQECPNRHDCFFLHALERENEIEENMHKPTKEMFERHLGLAEEVVRGSAGVLGGMVRRGLGGQKVVFPTVGEVVEEYGVEVGEAEKDNPESPNKQTISSIGQKQTFTVKSSQSVDSYIARLILQSYLKNTTKARSRLWFVHGQIDVTQQQTCSLRVKNYLSQQLLQQ